MNNVKRRNIKAIRFERYARLYYFGILYAGVNREKKLQELAKVNPQEYCLALGVNDDSEIFKDISSGFLVSPMKFFKKLKGE